MAKILNIHDAKTHLSKVLADIERTGSSYVICRNGKPIAELCPHRRTSRTARHPVLGRIKIMYDPTEPLAEGDWVEDEA